MNGPTVTVVAGRWGEFAALVDLDDGTGPIRVRFARRNKGTPWKCDACGRHVFSTCPHEIAARRYRQTTSTTPPEGARP